MGDDIAHRSSIPVQRLLLEAFSIVFAVVLALGVDEWRETRHLEEKAQKAHAHILEEVRSNRTFFASLHTNREIGFQLTQAMFQGTAEASVRVEVWDESKVAGNFSSWLSLLVTAEASLLQTYDALLEEQPQGPSPG